MESEHGENRVADGFFIGAGYRDEKCLHWEGIFHKKGDYYEFLAAPEHFRRHASFAMENTAEIAAI
jgi:hypothetical protein